MHRTTPLFILLILAVLPARAQDTSDNDGVRLAVLDYVEGVYEVAPERIARSVSRDLVKFGHWRSAPDQEFSPAPMNYDELHSLASRWNVDNRVGDPMSLPKEVEVLDVLDKIAVAKLTAQWGVDYFQLEKMDGRWMIRHVLWQSPPVK